MPAAIYKDEKKSRKAGKFSFFDCDIMILDESMTSLAQAIGGLIRMKSTGLSISYDWFFNVIFVIFFSLATIAWVPTLGWYAPILIGGFLNFAVRLLIEIGQCWRIHLVLM